MTDKLFFYHFEGQLGGTEGAAAQAIESNSPGINNEYGYLAHTEPIEGLSENLVHTAEFEEGLSNKRVHGRDIYNTAKENMDEITSFALESSFLPADIEAYDIGHIVQVPTEGYTPASNISGFGGVNDDVIDTVKKGLIDGRRENITGRNSADFYTNALIESELIELEEYIREL